MAFQYITQWWYLPTLLTYLEMNSSHMLVQKLLRFLLTCWLFNILPSGNNSPHCLSIVFTLILKWTPLICMLGKAFQDSSSFGLFIILSSGSTFPHCSHSFQDELNPYYMQSLLWVLLPFDDLLRRNTLPHCSHLFQDELLPDV